MCHICYTNELSSEYLKGLPPIFKQAMKDLHAGKITPQDLQGELLQAIARELWSGVQIGFNGDLQSYEGNTAQYLWSKAAEENVFVFSGFKTYNQLREASLLLYNKNGEIRPFNEFLKDVMAINKTYNINYLKAEYDNALVSGEMAQKWQEFDDNALLKFTATIDDNTTAICHSLNGLIKPKSWPGWRKYWLPLHWGERSNIVETFDQPTDHNQEDLADPIPMFNGNVGIDGAIFPSNHPYYQVCQNKNRVVKNASCQQLKNTITKNAKKIYRQFIYNLPQAAQYAKVENNIAIHRLAGTEGKDFKEVMLVAQYYAALNKDVKILPAIHFAEVEARKKLMPGAKNNTNADLLVAGKLVEVESTFTSKNLIKRIRKGYLQANNVVVILTNESQVLDFDNAAERIFYGINALDQLEELSIFNSKGKLLFYKKRKNKKGN